MKSTGREKKIVSAILVNLSCSIFNICPVNTSLTAAQSRAIANIAVHSSNTRIRAQKVTFPRPRKILTINLPSVSAPSPFSLLYLSYLIFPLFALSRSIVFPLSLRPFCVFVSSPLRLPPPRGRGEPLLKASSVFLFLTRAETRTIIWPIPGFFALSILFRSGATPRDNVSRKIPRGKYLARSLARSRCFTFH